MGVAKHLAVLPEMSQIGISLKALLQPLGVVQSENVAHGPEKVVTP